MFLLGLEGSMEFNFFLHFVDNQFNLELISQINMMNRFSLIPF